MPKSTEQKNLTAGKVYVTAYGARNLYKAQWFGKQDPYLQLSISKKGHAQRTAVSKDTERTADWKGQKFELVVPHHPGCFLCLEVKNRNTASDDTIGTLSIPLVDLCAPKYTAGRKWWAVGRGSGGLKPAGEIDLEVKFMLNDLWTRPVETSIPVLPSTQTGDVAAAAAEEDKAMGDKTTGDTPAAKPARVARPLLSGKWRVYERDVEGKARSYELSLRQSVDGSIEGEGKAAHMTVRVEGMVNLDSISYTMHWDAGMTAKGRDQGQESKGTSSLEATINEDATKFKVLQESGALLKAKKLDGTWDEVSHPHYFAPYVDLTGAWRVYCKAGPKEYSYYLQLKQARDGTLTGHGVAGHEMYEVVDGKVDLERNQITYTEKWRIGTDTIDAEIRWGGTYFVCNPAHADIQKARRLDDLGREEFVQYHLPYQ